MAGGEARASATAPESASHRLLKAAIAEHLASIDGWRTRIEFEDPVHGFRADVAAYNMRIRRKMGVEIQLSGQTPGTYLRRSKRYLAAGFLPVWVVRGWPAVFLQWRLPHLSIPVSTATPPPASIAQALTVQARTIRWLGEEGITRLTIAEFFTELGSDEPWKWNRHTLEPLADSEQTDALATLAQRQRADAAAFYRPPPAEHDPSAAPPASESERLRAMYGRLAALQHARASWTARLSQP